MDDTEALPTATAVACTGARPGFDRIRELLDDFRRTDRTAASDEDRLAWVDEIRDLSRRVTALSAVLLAEADEAGSSLRARHTRLEDWMARTGQETPREASGAVFTARALERRPAVRDAARRPRSNAPRTRSSTS